MRAAIVGCGVGGMAAALALRRRGHTVEIFERFDEPHPLGAGLLMQPSGLAALAAFGLEQRVRDWGAEVTRLYGRTPRGRPVLDLRYGRKKGVGVHRGALFQALYDAVRTAEIPVRAGVGIAAVDGVMRNAVALHGEDGSRHEGYELVVVADGAHSGLRRDLHARVVAPLYPWGAFWAILPDPDGAWTRDLAQVYDGAQVMIGVLPVGRSPAAAPGCEAVGHVSFFWSLKSTDFAAARAEGIGVFKQRVATHWPEVAPLIAPITSMEALSDATYRNVGARPWTRGRMVVIGDAAHGMSPQLGQGANMALIDALALAEAVGDADDPRPVPVAARDYRAARSAHVAFYQFMSWALTPVFQGDSRVIAALRDVFMIWLCRLPLVSNLMRATLTGRATFGLGRWRGAWEKRR